MRGGILANCKELSLDAEPNVGDNGMHVSASPLEALAGRNNWLNMFLEKDRFPKELHQRRSPSRCSRIGGLVQRSKWTKGAVKDLDTDACLNKCAILPR